MSGPQRLELATVAMVFEVEFTWLVEVCEVGLLRADRGADGVWRIDVDELPRVARIMRLCLFQGLDVAIAARWVEMR